MIGTSFSPLQCEYLGMDWQEAFLAIAKLDFDNIRLSAYWDRIEKSENVIDFSELDWLISNTPKNTQMILTVGAKAPRWPEFHIPNWVTSSTNFDINSQALTDTNQDNQRFYASKHRSDYEIFVLRFVERVIEHTRDNEKVVYYQIENEPLNDMDINQNQIINPELLKKEIELVSRKMRPDQKIMLTNAVYLWPNNTLKDEEILLRSMAFNPDAIGLNVYTMVPVENNKYLKPTKFFWQKLDRWRNLLADHNIEPWIVEAQAEPWEHGKQVHTEKDSYPSCSPESACQLVKNLENIGFQNILYWGLEYWYWQKIKGKDNWWKIISPK